MTWAGDQYDFESVIDYVDRVTVSFIHITKGKL